MPKPYKWMYVTSFNLSCLLTYVSLYVLLWLNIIDFARFRCWNGAPVVVINYFLLCCIGVLISFLS